MMNRDKARRRLQDALFYGLLILTTIVVIVPILFIVVSSFKTETQIFSSPWSLPDSLDFSVYGELFTRYNMGNYFANSITYALGGCVICLALTFPAAYAIARMRWKASKLALGYLVSGLMVPVHAIMIPLYIMVSRTPISNNTALLLIYAVTTIPTALFLFIGNLKAIPVSIEEAAVIDGCTIPKLLWHIIVPVSRGVIASVTIVSFLNIWNDLMLALVFLSNELEKTVQVGIMRFSDTYFTNYGLLLSAISVAIVPTILLFFVLSKQIITGITAGAVKE